MEMLDTFIQVSLQIMALVGIWFVILLVLGLMALGVWWVYDEIIR